MAPVSAVRCVLKIVVFLNLSAAFTNLKRFIDQIQAGNTKSGTRDRHFSEVHFPEPNLSKELEAKRDFFVIDEECVRNVGILLLDEHVLLIEARLPVIALVIGPAGE